MTISTENFILNGVKVFSNCSPRSAKTGSQYEGVIKWTHCDFSESFRALMKDEYKECLQGINIMPYRITANDVLRSVSNQKRQSFRDEILTDSQFVDYDLDMKSGNYHKKPDEQYQIVWTTTSLGPGWKDSRQKGTLAGTKTDWYFPHIGGADEDHEYSIDDLIWMAVKAALK